MALQTYRRQHSAPWPLHIYLPSFAGGGAERTFVRLANQYAASGIDTSMIVNNASGPLRVLVSDDVRVVELGVERSREAVLKLARYLRRERPKTVLSALTSNNLCAIAAQIISGTDAAIVVSERNQVTSLLQHARPLRRNAIKLSIRHLYGHARGIIAVAGGVAADLSTVSRVPAQAIHVIHNPAPEREEIEAARAAPTPHGWFDEDVPVIVAIGRLMPQKGYLTLLRALAKVRQTHPARLIILGEGPQHRELEAEAERLGTTEAVCFEGFRMNRLDYLVRASVYVLSSDTEGFPNALVEAVACGIPVVSTDCAGNGPREILAGTSDIQLVPVNEPEALAAAIVEQFTLPQTAEMLTALAERFTIAATAERYLDVLRGACR